MGKEETEICPNRFRHTVLNSTKLQRFNDRNRCVDNAEKDRDGCERTSSSTIQSFNSLTKNDFRLQVRLQHCASDSSAEVNNVIHLTGDSFASAVTRTKFDKQNNYYSHIFIGIGEIENNQEKNKGKVHKSGVFSYRIVIISGCCDAVISNH